MNSFFDSEIVIFKNTIDVAGLKQGQPSLFILSETKATLFEEPTLFLAEQYVQSGKSPSVHTWAAACDALKSWFEFLQATGRPWLEATRQDRRDYRDAYLEAISPRTGQRYDPATPRGRMIVIREFYRFAWKKGWYNGDLATTTVNETQDANVPIDKDALAHTRSRVADQGTGSGFTEDKKRVCSSTVSNF